MPGITFRCPSCDAPLRGPAHLAAGTRVRCNRCDVVFPYEDKAARPAPAERVSAVRPRAPRPDADSDPDAPARRPVPRGPKPARKKKAKGPGLGLILGLAGAGAGGLLLVIVGVVLFFMSGSKAPPPVAATPVAATAVPPAAPIAAPPVVEPFKAPPAPAVPPVPVAPAQPVALAPVPANGQLAPDVLDKVKKATVYIRVTSAQGQASGSGFFEGSSNQVLTNAHVIGMLHADEAPPQRIDVVLQSGEKEEKTLPGRIVTVDRSSDLAVLNVDFRAGGLAGPPASLAVASAAALRETQQVFVFGFPFGEGLGKNITVSTSSVSSLRKDKDGALTQVQVNGGMNPGNSGGPVVDAGGNVVGVAVAGIRNTQINFAIPGDFVQTVFNGRCSGISVGEAVRRGDQIAVPVDVAVIDPMRRISKFAVEWWAGDPTEAVPPAVAPPAGAGRQTVVVPLQADVGTGHAELLLAAVPPPGKVLWVQPMFVNGAGESHWSAGMPVPLMPPIDAKPAALALKPQQGWMRLDLKSTATVQVRTSDGEKHSLYSNIETKLLEDTRFVDPRGLATLYDSVEHFEIGMSVDGQGPPPSPRLKSIVQDVGKLGLSLTVDGQGNVTQKGRDLARVPQPSREALDGMGDQILQSLDVAAVPLPNGMANPGQQWRAVRNVPIDSVDSYQTATADMTYTYRGVRTINGQDMGVIELGGVVRPVKGKVGNLSGRVSGTALIDLTAGRVANVHAIVDVTMDIVFRDESLRSNGKLEVKLNRTGP